jgi:hypothetical protein
MEGSRSPADLGTAKALALRIAVAANTARLSCGYIIRSWGTVKC